MGTGGNAGIGKALCKLLAAEKGCLVYMGSRSLEKGRAAVQEIVAEAPSVAGKVEVVQIDVTDDATISAAAAELKSKGVQLFALVNNAGVGLAQPGNWNVEKILNTNLFGPKRVTEGLVDLITPGGRIVNVSSGGASGWLRTQSPAVKAIFSNPALTWNELAEGMDKAVATGAAQQGMGNGYGFSKACLTALTLVQAQMYPSLTVTSLSPGFIDTAMTAGFGARLTPEQGTVSSMKCLFGDVTSGFYYGSDGLRSPLTCTRDPGTPEYQGEQTPDPKVYNK